MVLIHGWAIALGFAVGFFGARYYRKRGGR